MYNRYEGITPNVNTGNLQDKYETFLAGYYDETRDNDANTNVVVILGCKTYTDFTTVNKGPYGLCMKGWI